jgi:hypothetical protein
MCGGHGGRTKDVKERIQGKRRSGGEEHLSSTSESRCYSIEGRNKVGMSIDEEANINVLDLPLHYQALAAYACPMILRSLQQHFLDQIHFLSKDGCEICAEGLDVDSETNRNT